MKTLLLTGFAPWDHYQRNAARELLRDQAQMGPQGWRIRCVEVPVSWQRAWPAVAAAWDETVLAVVAFGQAEDDAVRIERFAVNGSSNSAADVDGACFADDWIVAGGPAALHTGLPWRRLEQAVGAAGLPVRSSLSAGDYLCNHLAYRVLYRAAEDPGTLVAGFVHVPTLERMSLGDLNRVRQVVVEEVIDHLEVASGTSARAQA
ncbi:MAG: hypothetical protein JJT88_07065 [Gammaproteobacteria bacterium]|nr:hypothetical protein [Gammaproteobacteria bacterium]